MENGSTPMVDGAILWRFDDQKAPQGYVDADFARQLERELTAALTRVAELEGKLKETRDHLDDETIRANKAERAALQAGGKRG